MTSSEIIAEFSRIARERNLDPAALLAVAELESGLRAHAVVEGRREPLIRFEGHYFDRRLSTTDRAKAREAGLASPRAGGVANPASQAARWKLLQRAAAIDRKAAYESVSWGLGQVMGAHWAWLGYASVEALVAEARAGVGGQVRLMTTFIDKAGLAGALRSHDWAAFARGYNGPAYHRNAYDKRLAAAYRRQAALLEATRNDGGELRSGARGEAVRQLQSGLVQHGFALAVDGMFGPVTERSVREFQRMNGLPRTGIACAATREKISAAVRPRPAAGLRRHLDRIFGWLGLPRLFANRI